MRMGKAALLVVAAVLVTGLAAAGCGNGSSSGPSNSGLPKGTIKLGALFTLSGPSAPIGLAQKETFTVLVERLNEEGGIAGRDVELVSYNDKGEPATAVAMANKLVSDSVGAIVYYGTSATRSQTVPVFTKAKLPQVVLDGSPTYDEPTKYPYTFTTYPSSAQIGAETVEYAQAHGTKKLGLITDGLPFGEEVEAGIQAAASESGLTLVGPITYSPTAVDVTTQLRQLQGEGADGLAILASSGLGHIYDGLRTLGWTPPLYANEVARFVGYEELGSLAGDIVNTCGVPLKMGGKLDPGITSVLEAVSAKDGVTPSTPSAVIFNDDLGILKVAIEKAKTLDPETLSKTIEELKDFSYTSPTYKYTFSSTQHNGFPASSVGMCRLKPMGPFDYPYAAPGN
jgi:branched-chain amino acid transport system substrate-binding protein